MAVQDGDEGVMVSHHSEVTQPSQENITLNNSRLRRERSTQRRILSEFFLRVTTIGAHHSVGVVTGAMTPWA